MIALGAMLSLAAAAAIRAGTPTWADLGTDFGTPGNWIPSGAPTNNITTDIATFGSAAPTNQPILNASQSVAGVVFTNTAGPFVFSGNSTVLTVGVSGLDNQSAATQTLDATLGLTLGAASQFSVSSTGALTIASTVNTNGFALTLTGAGTGTGSISGIISGTGGLTKSGTGTWTLSGANTYTGLTTVSAGTLSAQNGAALGDIAGATTVTSGATLNLSNVVIGAEGLTISGTGVGGLGALTGTGTASLSGTVALGAASTIGVAAGAAGRIHSRSQGWVSKTTARWGLAASRRCI